MERLAVTYTHKIHNNINNNQINLEESQPAKRQLGFC